MGYKSKNKIRKAQAALEFLTTYAWAFLVILIMIGALAYFGILKPTKLLPDRCNFGTEIGCIDYQIAYGSTGADGKFNLRLRNNAGEAIKIPLVATTGITVSSESAIPYSCTLSQVNGAAPPTDYTWGTGTTTDFSFTNCNSAAAGIVQGEKGKVSVEITYYLAKSSADYTHKVNGEVFTTVI